VTLYQMGVQSSQRPERPSSDDPAKAPAATFISDDDKFLRELFLDAKRAEEERIASTRWTCIIVAVAVALLFAGRAWS
jgi:hypothetical protein